MAAPTASDDDENPMPERDLATQLIHHPYQPPAGFDAPQPGVFKASTVIFPTTAAMRARTDVVRVIDVDGVRAVLPGGWGLVRASNTQPALVMRCEATDGARLAEIRALLEAEIARARGAA